MKEPTSRTRAANKGVSTTQEQRGASGKAVRGGDENSASTETSTTPETTKPLGEPLSSGMHSEGAGGSVASGQPPSYLTTPNSAKNGPPSSSSQNGVYDANRVEPTVWLTCTRVERVSAIPSIEWTGFFGTDPSVTRTLNPIISLGQIPTHPSQTITPPVSQPLPERSRRPAGWSLERATKPRRLAAGFSATEFLIWDLEQQSEVVKVTCGGWHRPHSFWIGRPGGAHVSTCFAYVKDDVIHVYRKGCVGSSSQSGSVSGQESPPQGTKSRLTEIIRREERGSEVLGAAKGLQSAFHGRELHTTKFVPGPGGPGQCVVTGGEDGTVRFTRCVASC